MLVEDETYAPAIDLANFDNPIINDYFPLQPGFAWVYEGGDERVEVTVTDQTKVIMGITTNVITDKVFVDGQLQEDTVDWYAADDFGNVWYFGEQTAEYENGAITTTEGSWEAGVDGALRLTSWRRVSRSHGQSPRPRRMPVRARAKKTAAPSSSPPTPSQGWPARR